MKFNYEEAFSRNIGLLTEEEQEKLKKFTIAIAGMGAMGESYLISFIRQGFQNFKIADFDTFELKNLNRQYGANISTIGKKKTHVMKELALQINPNCKIEIYGEGINQKNINSFLEDVDLVLDGMDFFEVDTRRMLFNKSHENKIPLITAGPIGFSVAMLIFLPSSPNFDDYFQISDSTPYIEKLVKFAGGLTPKLLQRKYIRSVSLKEKKGPSSIASINLCTGAALVNALKILLKRGEVRAVPYYHQYDAYLNKFALGRIIGGNKNPFQKLKIKIAVRMMQSKNG